jgi:DNA-binding HxlR family transcriptional regulator
MTERRRRSVADYSPATTKDYELCGAVESARKIGNQWRLIVVRYLLERPMRFSELLRVACGIDPKTLSRVLNFLAKEKIIRRDVLGTKPPIIRYSLTEKGREISPIMLALKAWGEAWILPEISVQRG